MVKPKIKDVVEGGEFITSYPIDEDYQSNVGDAEVYKYKGKKYEVIRYRGSERKKLRRLA